MKHICLDSKYKKVIDWLYVCYMKSLKLPEAVNRMTDDLLQDQVYKKSKIEWFLDCAMHGEMRSLVPNSDYSELMMKPNFCKC